MSKIGYLLCKSTDIFLDEDVKWMNEFGCTSIVKENYSDEKYRPRFKEMIMKLGSGDVFVVSHCSKAFRTLTDMSLFFTMCHSQNIRFISIHDKIDTEMEVFPMTNGMDILSLFRTIPEETKKLRHENDSEIGIETIPSRKFRYPQDKKEKEMLVLNMYQDGYSIQDIWFSTGLKRTSDVYRILNKNNIKPNRKGVDREYRFQHKV